MKKILEILKSIGILLLYLLLPPFLMALTNLNIIPYIILAIIYILIYKKEYLKIKEINKKTILTGLVCWLIGLALMYVTAMILTHFLSSGPQNQNAVIEKLNGNKIPTIINAILLIPFLEETAFRLSFKKSITNKYLYVIITSLIFGFLHVIGEKGINLIFIIPYMMPAIAFAIANVKTDNMYSSIIFHMLHNALSIILVL
jgi:membrane protease YdiL (CAAX protease family)